VLVGSDPAVCSGATNGVMSAFTCSERTGWSSDIRGLLGMMPSSQVLLQVSENCGSYATMRARKKRILSKLSFRNEPGGAQSVRSSGKSARRAVQHVGN
jgi:hypothetical protein